MLGLPQGACVRRGPCAWLEASVQTQLEVPRPCVTIPLRFRDEAREVSIAVGLHWISGSKEKLSGAALGAIRLLTLDTHGQRQLPRQVGGLLTKVNSLLARTDVLAHLEQTGGRLSRALYPC